MHNSSLGLLLCNSYSLRVLSNFNYRMFKLWQRLFRKASDSIVPIEFPLYTDKAILLITNSNGQLEDVQVLDLFVTNSIPHKEAIELLLFLPTAFCRHMLSQLDWLVYYIEQTATDKNREVTYASNARYIAIQDALSRYLAGNFTQKDYLKVAARDASFKSLNQLLANGGRLEDAIISPEIIIR